MLEPSGNSINWESALEAVGGDRDLLREVVDAFRNDAPRHLRLLVNALGVGDAVAVRRAAHTLKGNGRYFGVCNFVELAQSIEDSAHRGELTGLAVKAEQLQGQLESVLAALTHLPGSK